MVCFRYGKFKPKDYWGSWLCICLLLTFAIASIILNLSVVYICFPLVYACMRLWAIVAPHNERFRLEDNSIVLLKKKEKTILLPSELTLIISETDICPPLTKRTVFGNETHILREQYSVTLLKRTPVREVLELLHANRARIYTTSMIRTLFEGDKYIYSFVCDDNLLRKLTKDRVCQLIIPETLKHMYSLETLSADIYIDKTE